MTVAHKYFAYFKIPLIYIYFLSITTFVLRNKQGRLTGWNLSFDEKTDSGKINLKFCHVTSPAVFASLHLCSSSALSFTHT